METRMLETSYTGLQLDLRMSRQISPFLYTFGWKMGVLKTTSGGLHG